MNILVFPLCYPNEINKTANIFTKEQVEELSKLHNIEVAFVHMLPTRMLFHKKEHGIIEYDDSTKVYKIYMHSFLESKFPKLNGWLYKKYAFKLLNYVTKSKRIDCIYAHFSIYSGWAATLFGKKNNIPVVVQEHDGKLISSSICNTRKKMLLEVCKNAAGVMCVSTNLKKHIEQFTHVDRDYNVIGNIVPGQFTYHPRTKKSDFVFLCVANLYPGKNIDLLIESFCLAFGKSEKIQLQICGDGDCRKKLLSIIEKNHREEQIHLLGRLKRSEIMSEYINCDCFVLPSDHETFGIVYREAMAIGRPVISTNHGGFENGDIDESNGIIVKPTLDDISKALISVKNNIASYDLENISKKCLSKYGKDIIISRISKALIDAQSQNVVKNNVNK